MKPLSTVIAFLCLAATAAAQTPAPSARQATVPFPITDNSFLVEEAYNQDPGVVQNILGFAGRNGGWRLAFTQEWPAPNRRHQLSYTLRAESIASKSGFGDVYLNYRVQALEEGPGRPAFSPRVSVIVPSGRISGGQAGVQFGLPLSKQRHDWHFNGNGGVTWLPRGERRDLVSLTLAGSAIYRLRPMLYLMLESVVGFDAGDSPGGTVERIRAFTFSPGLRGGWSLAEDTQIVLGAAIPMIRVSGESSIAGLVYFSYELPFKR